jgi:hypothetical protein
MSNIVSLANVQVPAHLAQRVGVPSILSQSLSGGISGGGGEAIPRISIKASRFRIVEGTSETVLDTTSLDVVVVGANPRLSKTWYAKAWTPESEPSSPDCFSLDGISPDTASTDPQNDLCASCPQNAWGSKITPQGKQIKACADQKRLAVVSVDDPSGPVYLLQVTPAALAGLGQYQKELSHRGIPAEIVRTRIGFDTDASFPKLKFSFGGFLDEDTQTAVDGLFGSDSVKDITGEARHGGVPAVPKISAPQQVAPKPAPVVAQPAPTPVAETQPDTPKRGFGAPKKAATPPAPAPQAKATPAPVTTAPSASSLADEIAALVGEVNADDA